MCKTSKNFCLQRAKSKSEQKNDLGKGRPSPRPRPRFYRGMAIFPRPRPRSGGQFLGWPRPRSKIDSKFLGLGEICRFYQGFDRGFLLKFWEFFYKLTEVNEYEFL